LSEQIGLARPPRILLGDAIGAPFVCDALRPALVLPRDFMASLSPLSARSVLLHELAHLKRSDLIWGWIPTIARVVYVFHPAAHYIAFRTRLEQELACDQAAMVLTDQTAAGYAGALVDVVARVSAPLVTRPR
jgi:beta-lactamase regulating signal transducer with metallopeptidase domain